MQLYRKEDLSSYKEEAPFFTHPYLHLKENVPQTISLLERIADALTCVGGFEERLKEARENAKKPLNFYAFMTEIKVAGFLKEKLGSVSFLNGRNEPDLQVGNVYVEIHMPLKQFPIIYQLQEELWRIDNRFRFQIPHYLSIDPVERPDIIFTEINQELKKYKNKTLTTYPQSVYKTRDLIGYLGEGDNYQAGVNAGGDPEETIQCYYRETLRRKMKIDGKTEMPLQNYSGEYVLHNGLNNHHPNLLWSEWLFLEEMVFSMWDEFDWTQSALPKHLDALIITVCGIDCTYDSVNRGVALINEKSGNAKYVEAFVKKLFSEIRVVKIKKLFEDANTME